MPHINWLPIPECERIMMIQQSNLLKMELHWVMMLLRNANPCFAICTSFFTWNTIRKMKLKIANKWLKLAIYIWNYEFNLMCSPTRKPNEINKNLFVCKHMKLYLKKKNERPRKYQSLQDPPRIIPHFLFILCFGYVFVIPTNDDSFIRHVKKSCLIRHVPY